MLLPALVCPVCVNKLVLPYRSFFGSTLVESYWPEESFRLSWVCDVCTACTSFAQEQTYWGQEEEFASPRQDWGFWRIEVPCGEPSCERNITAYTRTTGKTSRRFLGTAVATCNPVPRCQNGFSPEPHAYPLRIDFVEWTGGEEYLH